jgi:hypothetical protein
MDVAGCGARRQVQHLRPSTSFSAVADDGVQNWGNHNPATNSFAAVSGQLDLHPIGLFNGSFGGSLTGLTSFSCLNDATCSWEFDNNLSSLNGYAGGARCQGQVATLAPV